MTRPDSRRGLPAEGMHCARSHYLRKIHSREAQGVTSRPRAVRVVRGNDATERVKDRVRVRNKEPQRGGESHSEKHVS